MKNLISPTEKICASESIIETTTNFNLQRSPTLYFSDFHTLGVCAVAYSLNGRHIVSASYDNTLKLWDTESGRCLRSFNGHTKSVKSVTFSSDGFFLVSGSGDKTLKLWEVATGECIRTFEGHKDSVVSVAFSSDNRMLVSSGADDRIKLWRTQDGQCVKTIKQLYDNYSYYDRLVVFFLADDQYIVSSNCQPQIILWDIANNLIVRKLEGHTASIISLTLSPDRTLLLSGSADKTLKLWDIATGNCIRTFEGHRLPIYAVAFSPDGRHIASASEDRSIKLWNIESGKVVCSLEAYNFALVINSLQQVFSVMTNAIAFSPDGRFLASGGGGDKILNLWDVNTGRCVRSFGSVERVNSVAFSPNGDWIASHSNNKINLWDVSSLALRKTINVDFKIAQIIFSPDGKYIASAHDKVGIFIWQISTGEIVNKITNITAGFGHIAFSPDGCYLAVTHFYGGSVKIFEVSTGDSVHEFEVSTGGSVHEFYFQSIYDYQPSLFSPNGLYLAALDGTNIKLVDLETGLAIKTFKNHTSGFRKFIFSPDASYMVTTSNDISISSIKLWQVSTGEVIRTFDDIEDDICCVAFSPDGLHIASGGNQRNIIIWESSTGSQLRSLERHDFRIESINFSPDGQYIVAGGSDRGIHLWDVATGKKLVKLVSWIDNEYLSMTPEGFYKASSSLIEQSSIDVHYTDGQVTAITDEISQSYHRQDLLESLLVIDHIRLNAYRSVANENLGGIVVNQDEPAPEPEVELDIRNLLTVTKPLLVNNKQKGIKSETLSVENNKVSLVVNLDYLSTIKTVRFSPDGQSLAFANNKRKLFLWHLSKGENPHQLTGDKCYIDSADFSLDGKSIISGGDCAICLWDVATGQVIKKIALYGSRNVLDLEYKIYLENDDYDDEQQDVRWEFVAVYFVSQTEVHVRSRCSDATFVVDSWDIEAGKKMIKNEPVIYSSRYRIISRGGRAFMVEDNKDVIALSGDTELYFDTEKRHISEIALSPCGSKLLGLSGDRILLWDTATGKVLGVFEGNVEYIHSVSFSPNGKMIVSVTDDHAIRLWCVQTTQLLATLINFSESEWLCVQPDGFYCSSSATVDDYLLLRIQDEELVAISDDYRQQYYRPNLLIDLMAQQSE